MGSYLGQNFLKDIKTIKYISEHIKKLYNDLGAKAIIEIGPGKGAITKHIKSISDNFFVIEKDIVMKDNLGQILKPEQIVFDDILELDISSLLHNKGLEPEHTLIIGNLPYYITSPILRKFFEGDSKYAGGFFMIQKEVGEKIDMTAKKKSYLWWLLNYANDVLYRKTVSAKHFSPPPRVDSCLVSISSTGLKNKDIKYQDLKSFIDTFAPFSRKTLGKIAKMTDDRFYIPEQLKSKRLEELRFEDIYDILNQS